MTLRLSGDFEERLLTLGLRRGLPRDSLLANSTAPRTPLRGFQYERPRADPYAMARTLGGEVVEAEDGLCVVVERTYDLPYQHGCVELGSPADGRWHALAQVCGIDHAPPLDQLVFLDIETTGLAGGTGTYVFLIGLGYVKDCRFQVEQYLIPDLPDERAMLHLVHGLLARFTGLVTFNGKAFDWPLLETRFRLSRLRPPLRDPLHLDLLFPSRRVWRRRLESCALHSLEEHVLGLERQIDAPGWLIPTIYFDYLRSGNPLPLIPVLAHNAQDVVSLLALAAHLEAVFTQPSDHLDSAEELFSVGQIWERQGRVNECLDLYAAAARRAQSLTLRADILTRQALLYRQLSRFDEACDLWRDLAVDCPQGVPTPYVELAKHYEHREKDYPTAISLVQEALRLLSTSASPWARQVESKSDALLRHRLARLEAKLARSSDKAKG